MARGRPAPNIILGPVLYFRGEQGDRWWLSALFVLEGEAEPYDLRVDGVTLPVPPRHLAHWRNRHVWRFDFAIPRGARDVEAAYGFTDGASPGDTWAVTVPGRASQPRIAYVSCNGVEDEEKIAALNAPRNALWGNLRRRHESERFHLLLQGGDQLYADAVWRQPPLLTAWKKRTDDARLEEPFTPAMAEEAADFYFDLYLRVWGQPETAAVTARIPSVMMWDDHDIFDGWGSHPDEEMMSPAWRGVYTAARRHFSLFQLAAMEDAQPECVWGAPLNSFSQGFRLGDIGVLALDMRSDRTPRRVLSDRVWDALPEWLERFKGCRHLILMSSVPLLYLDTGVMERAIGLSPVRVGIEDDLRDQWRSPAHAEEWLRLLSQLVEFSRRTGCRVTSVSGEIHAGARAVLRGGGVEIWQLIASGVVHPPPAKATAFALEWLAGRKETLDNGYVFEMPAFPESGKRIIRQRNWLSLIFDGKGQIHARWSAEGQPNRYTQVI
ncbi:alkaline phosphatase D family protein [Azospirillum argentinense]